MKVTAPMMVLREIEPQIFHAFYSTHYDVSMAFCRLNEWTESPNESFMGNPIAMEDYMRWYALAKGKGVFGYPADWDGFNVRSTAIEAIQEMHNLGGKYQMSNLEMDLIQSVQIVSPYARYSVIGTSKQSDRGTLVHEIAHGRWYVNSVYHERMLDVVHTFRKEAKPLFTWLRKEGYHKNVFEDETHAYALTGWPTGTNNTLEITEGLLKLKAALQATKRSLVKDGQIPK